MKNLYCRQILTQNYNLIPIQEIKKKWNTECKNKETLSGYPVYLFDKLRITDGNYCARPDQLDFFNVDPYTNKRFIKFYGKTIPITQEYNNKLCPLSQLNANQSPNHVFLISNHIVYSIKQLPDEIPVETTNPSFSKIRFHEYIVINIINPSQIYSAYYYVLKIRNKNRFVVKKKDIVRLYPVYAKETAIDVYKTIDNDKIKQELSSYFTYTIKKFTENTLKFFREIRICVPEPIKVYRGILIHNLILLQKAKLDKLTTGDTMSIDSRDLPVSWSTDSCLSQYFATNSPAKEMRCPSGIRFGIVYSCVLKPDQIAIDTRLIDRNFFLDKLYVYDQQEIITFPHLPNGELNKFECKIERLFIVNFRYKTIVHSFKKFIPLLLKN